MAKSRAASELERVKHMEVTSASAAQSLCNLVYTAPHLVCVCVCGGGGTALCPGDTPLVLENIHRDTPGESTKPTK